MSREALLNGLLADNPYLPSTPFDEMSYSQLKEFEANLLKQGEDCVGGGEEYEDALYQVEVAIEQRESLINDIIGINVEGASIEDLKNIKSEIEQSTSETLSLVEKEAIEIIDKEIIEKYENRIPIINFLEKESMRKAFEYVFSYQDSSIEEIEPLADEISNKLFDSYGLSEEQMEKISLLTGREKVGLAGLIWTSATAVAQTYTQITGNNSVNFSTLFNKFINRPVSMLAMGNIINKGIKDFEDGASASEIGAFIFQTSMSLFSATSFVDSFISLKSDSLLNGNSFLDTLGEEYFGKINMLKPKHNYVYSYDLDHNTFATTRIVSDDISDIIPTIKVTSNTLDGIEGSYRTLDGIGNVRAPRISSDSLGVKTNVDLDPSSGSKALNVFGIGVDLAWIGQAITDIADSKGDVKNSQIMNLVGAIVCTTGDVIGLVGGPMGELAGSIISGVGSLVAAAGGLADLTSDSTTEERTTAAIDFITSTSYIIPSATDFNQFDKFKELEESATNDIDKTIYGAFRRIAELNATPIANLFNFIYDYDIKEEATNKLIEHYGSLDNMMTTYIHDDKQFSNRLEEVYNYLKNSAHTTSTQYLTAYLTPEYIREICGNHEDYNDMYNVLNRTNLKVKGEFINGGYELTSKNGITVLPPGENLRNVNGRDVLETLSLGYGEGKQNIQDEDGNSIKNPRVIDTITYVSYSKDQLQRFSNEIKEQHTITTWHTEYNEEDDVFEGYVYDKVEDPRYEKYKCWIDLVDDISGTKAVLGYRWTEVTDPMIPYSGDTQMISVPDMKVIEGVKNRVITTISDVIFPNIQTKAGDDDVIVNDIERIYTGNDSVVKINADGGEGFDILDISNLKENDGQTFSFEYSVEDNNFRFVRRTGDGRDYDWSFSNFEELRIGKVHNDIRIKEGSDIELSEGQNPEEIRIISIGDIGKSNRIDFSNVHGKSLYFQGNLDGRNEVYGTENNDTIIVPKVEGKIGNGSSEIFGMGGNDMIIGGSLVSEIGYNPSIGAIDENDVMNGGSINSNINNQILYDPNRTKLQRIDNVRKNILHGGEGTDYIKANGDHNILYGDEGRDFLQGSDQSGIHILNGGLDNDILYAGKAATELNGDEGNDVLTGNIGRDILNGGTGNDFLTGGGGADNFVFSKDFGRDVIQDYESIDKLIFDETSGVSNIEDIQFIVNENQEYLALLHDSNCVKINNWTDDTKLNIVIGGTNINADLIENLIKSAMSFDEYGNTFLESQKEDANVGSSSGSSEASTAPAPQTTTTSGYSTETRHTPVYSSSSSYGYDPLYSYDPYGAYSGSSAYDPNAGMMRI